MGRLIDDLLTLARTDSNQLQIHAAEIPLNPILEEIAEQFELLAETKSIRIHSHFEPSVIWADRRQDVVLLAITCAAYCRFSELPQYLTGA